MSSEYQPLAWQIVTDAKGFQAIHETDEDGNPGDLVANVWGDHANLIVAAPTLFAQLTFAVKLLSAFPALSGTAQVEAMRQALTSAQAASA